MVAAGGFTAFADADFAGGSLSGAVLLAAGFFAAIFVESAGLGPAFPFEGVAAGFAADLGADSGCSRFLLEGAPVAVTTAAFGSATLAGCFSAAGLAANPFGADLASVAPFTAACFAAGLDGAGFGSVWRAANGRFSAAVGFAALAADRAVGADLGLPVLFAMTIIAPSAPLPRGRHAGTVSRFRALDPAEDLGRSPAKNG